MRMLIFVTLPYSTDNGSEIFKDAAEQYGQVLFYEVTASNNGEWDIDQKLCGKGHVSDH